VAVPFEWKSGEWTLLKLQVRKIEDGLWRVEGKAWLEDSRNRTVGHHLGREAGTGPGRPGAWGSPFSGTPIWYDDLVVTAVEESR
jgi:hypothetical protein